MGKRNNVKYCCGVRCCCFAQPAGLTESGRRSIRRDLRERDDSVVHPGGVAEGFKVAISISGQIAEGNSCRGLRDFCHPFRVGQDRTGVSGGLADSTSGNCLSTLRVGINPSGCGVDFTRGVYGG